MRPSDLYAIHDEFAAYCFDRAVFTFGLTVEDKMRRAAKGAKTEKAGEQKAMMVLHKYLADPNDTRGRFKDPAVRR